MRGLDWIRKLGWRREHHRPGPDVSAIRDLARETRNFTTMSSAVLFEQISAAVQAGQLRPGRPCTLDFHEAVPQRRAVGWTGPGAETPPPELAIQVGTRERNWDLYRDLQRRVLRIEPGPLRIVRAGRIRYDPTKQVVPDLRPQPEHLAQRPALEPDADIAANRDPSRDAERRAQATAAE